MSRIISNSACLACNAEAGFEMFTENEKVQSWLCPLADIEPVLGGKYELFWNPSDRMNDSTIGCRITSIDYPRHISFDWKGPKEFKHLMNNADPLTHVAVFLIPTDAGCSKPNTKVQLLHTGWRNTPEWEKARNWFIIAWEKALYELENLFSA